MIGLAQHPIEFTPAQIEFIRTNGPRVELNRVVYLHGTPLGANIFYTSPSQRASSPLELLVMSAQTRDVERVTLVDVQQSSRRATADPLPIQPIGTGEQPTRLDGILQIRPGEAVIAMVSYTVPEAGFPVSELISADVAWLYDPHFSGSPSQLRPEIALQADEADAAVYGKSLATLARLEPDGYGVGQIAVDELLFAPKSSQDLNRFLLRTGGTVVESYGQGPFPVWVSVRITPPLTVPPYFSQLRDLFGDSAELLSSRSEGLSLYAYALELTVEGFQVALHPRAYQFGDAASVELRGTNAFQGEWVVGTNKLGVLERSFSDPIYGIRRMWASVAMWDADLKPVKVAFIDTGFTPNNDWRGYAQGLVHEFDLATGETGLGTAIGLPSVGASYFGPKVWHGTMMLSVAAGMLNNGDGTVGTGGQVVQPMLYEMSTPTAYLAKVGTAIEQAVTDGADVINISSGIPCRLLWVLGPENLCNAAGRLAFLAKLTLIVETLETGLCTVGAIVLGPVGDVACILIGSVSQARLIQAAAIYFLANFETKGSMEKAVAVAVSAGVPVVAAAGNELGADGLGPLSLLLTEKQINNTNIDDWQIIPGVIPDVICVGAVNPYAVEEPTPGTWINYYENLHFYGTSVDIWAPIWSNWYGPTNPAVGYPSAAVYNDDANGSSAAVPYITGIIANMMAINPSLHPGNTSLSEFERSSIVTRITEILDDTAYKPGIASSDGSVVIPLPSTALSANLNRRMLQRRNLVNPLAAWEAAAAGIIPDIVTAGFDFDYGHESDGITTSSVRRGDDVGDSRSDAERIGGLSGGDSFKVADEIHFIWPNKPLGMAVTDVDHFVWQAPSTGSPNTMYRQRFKVIVPDFAKSLPWVSNWRGDNLGTNAGYRSFLFNTPWIAEGDEFGFFLHTPQFTDTPFILESDDLLVSPMPAMDVYDLADPRNDHREYAAVPVGSTWIWTEDVTGRRFDKERFRLSVTHLTLHNSADVDWFALTVPAPETFKYTPTCTPILWISTAPYDPNLRIEVYDPISLVLLAHGKGSDRIRLPWMPAPGLPPSEQKVLIKVDAFSGTLHEYTLEARLSNPGNDVCCCWKRIISTSFPPYIVPELPAASSGCNVFLDVDWLLGSRVLPDLPAPDYGGGTVYALNGEIRTPLTYLVDHNTDGGECWLSAFLGHDQNFSGTDQSLRMDLFDVMNCNWIAGAITRNGVRTVIARPGVPSPVPAPHSVGDLDLYVASLEAGSYILALTWFKEGDSVGLVLNDSSLHDSTPSVINAYSAAGSPEVIIGPDSSQITTTTAAPRSFHPFSRPDLAMHTASSATITFTTMADTLYFVEVRREDGQWFRLPGSFQDDGELKQVRIAGASRGDVRVLSSSGFPVVFDYKRNLRLRFRPERGALYAYEVSSDLSDWSPLSEVVGYREIEEFDIPIGTGQQFFRVKRITPAP